MAKLKIGKLPVYKGLYVEGTSYNLHNLVTYDGTTYQSKIDNNTSPIDSDNWVIIAKGMNTENLEKLDSIEYGAQKNTIEAIDTTVGETPDTTIYTKGEVDYLLNNKVNRVEGKDLVSDQKINNYDQHIVNKLNPHDVTKSQVGLGNVTNDAQVKRTEMGTSNGVATLDANGKVLSSLLPSFVDDVLEYSSVNAFPTQGESGKIYIALDNNKTYRWGGSSYVVISETLALGETETTAYSGKKGADLATSVNNHIGDSTHITSAERTSWNNKYNKPSDGIPYSDLGSGVQTSLGKADSALQPISGSSLVPDTKISSYDAHIVNKSNPHGVTKSQVGLSNVDNTADKDKIVAEANKVTIESVRDTSSYTTRLTFELTDGAVTLEKVEGNSVVWNQWVDEIAPSSSFIQDGITYTTIKNGTIIANGIADRNTTIKSKLFQCVALHKYLFSGFYEGSRTTYFVTALDIYSTSIFMYNPHIYNPSTSMPIAFCINITSGTALNNLMITPQIIDLTQMFGAGNEPSTYEEFLERKPIVEDEYAYNEGEIMNVTPVAKKNTGVNLWDELWEVKDDVQIISKNFIKVNTNTDYYFKTNSQVMVAAYDVNKNLLGNVLYGSGNTVFNSGNNCHYLKFTMYASYGITYKNDICINVSDPTINGKYFPYEEKAIPIPTTLDCKPITLLSAGDVRDEIDLKRKKVVRKVGSVDLGTLDFTQTTAKAGHDVFYIYNVAPTIKCGYYPAALTSYCIKDNSYSSFETVVVDTFGMWGGSTGVRLAFGVTKGKYANAASFKAAMHGQSLLYALAEPYEEDIIVPATSAECIGNGMEIIEYNGAVPTITALYTKGQAAKWDTMPDPSDIYTKQKIEHMISDKPSMISTTVTSTPNTNVYTKAEVDALLSELRTLINNK